MRGDMMRKWLLPVVMGILGVALAVGAIHVYNDHRAHHEMLEFLTKAVGAQKAREAAAAKASAGPAAQ